MHRSDIWMAIRLLWQVNFPWPDMTMNTAERHVILGVTIGVMEV